MDLQLTDEYIDCVKVNVINRTFYLYGTDGSYEEIRCETPEQFLSVLEFTKSHSNGVRIEYVSN
jgi:hypothetical protein